MTCLQCTLIPVIGHLKHVILIHVVVVEVEVCMYTFLNLTSLYLAQVKR